MTEIDERAHGCGAKALSVLSPTWAYAEHKKAPLNDAGKTGFIRTMNAFYLKVAVALAFTVFLLSWNDLSEIQTNARSWTDSIIVAQLLKFFLAGYLLSRCTEVLFAFYRDAAHKLQPKKTSNSLLGWGERVRLALRSYLELILNFALLYAMLPASMWQSSYPPRHLTDVIFYSASTITTSGGGGFVPSHWLLQGLTVYEIACGLILLVVSFTVYVGHGLAAFERGGDVRTRGDAPAGPTSRSDQSETRDKRDVEPTSGSAQLQ